MSDRVDVRKRRAEEALPAPAASAAADDDEPAKPKKKDFRTRAHSNVLNANDFWFPASPAEVPLAQYFPERAAGARVEFLDVGCGYGSLLLELAAIFPRALMLGVEIRPKVVEYVQKRVIALRHEARRARGAGGAAEGAAAAAAATAGGYEHVWAIHNNTMRFLPNFFERGQLAKIFICFPDPHFKRKNHRKRIVTPALCAEYAYALRDGGLLYAITDVAELMEWMVSHLTASPLFERLPNAALRADPAVAVLPKTDEGLKVRRNNGNMFIAVYRKRLDPLAPRPEPPLLGNDVAAAAAADAGYAPVAGGERRGKTW